MLTIQIPQDLAIQLNQLATQLNLPIETFIIQSLQQLTTSEDTPKAEVLEGLYRALKDVKAGRLSPIETLWEDEKTDDINTEPQTKRGGLGRLKGQIWMSDDFDAPLEDLQEYM